MICITINRVPIPFVFRIRNVGQIGPLGAQPFLFRIHLRRILTPRTLWFLPFLVFTWFLVFLSPRFFG